MTNKEIEEFKAFLKTELRNCNGYAFIDRATDDLLNAIKPHKTFKVELFYEWFKSKNVVYMNSPISFLVKCGIEDIKQGNFDATDEFNPLKNLIAIMHLFNAFRENSITLEKYDDQYIETFETYVIANGIMSVTEMRDWNHKAVKYLAHKGKTSKDFIYLFKNTRDMRSRKIPYDEIEKKFEEDKKEYDKLLDSLSSDTAMDEDEFPWEDEVTKQLESETKNNENNRKIN